jgi:hypothetical protein
MNTPPALGSASHLIENSPDEFLVTLVETGAVDVSVEYPEGDTRDGLRSDIESMESTIETRDDVDTTVVSEVTVARAVGNRIERKEQRLTGGNAVEIK